MINILITTISKSTALVINAANDGDVLVVSSAKQIRGKIVYDLRQASKQQIRLLDVEHSTDLGDESGEFLAALLDHTVGEIHNRLSQLMG